MSDRFSTAQTADIGGRDTRGRPLDAFQNTFAAYLARTVSLARLRNVIVRCVLDDWRLSRVIGDSFASALAAKCLSPEDFSKLAADLERGRRRARRRGVVLDDESRILRGRYEIRQRIAAGGVGVLYRAVDLKQLGTGREDTTVAVKMLADDYRRDSHALRSLQCEAGIARRLSHPNVRTVYDLDRCGNDVFVTMEWLEGESLARRLDRTGPRAMPRQPAYRILSAVGSGLTHAHERGIVHGDVKPANVFITTDGRIKLLDFGQAWSADAAHDSSAQHAISPAYASCERHEGARPEISDDVFALAVMAYRILSGARPFGRYTPPQAEEAGILALRPAGLSWRQWRVLQKGLAWRRVGRPRSVAEFLTALLPPPEPRDRDTSLTAAA